MEASSSDPVETVRHHWENHGDLGDPRAFLAMGSLLRTHQLMVGTLERTLKPFDLNRNSYLMLSTVLLSSHGARLLSHIATHMLVHPTTVTLLADKLEAQGLITREPHPSDRRATYAKITPAGRALVKEATRALRTANFGLQGLSPADAQRLVEFLRPIRQAAGDLNGAGESGALRTSRVVAADR
jgi:DNA-binding MarR family transcriptional regulator